MRRVFSKLPILSACFILLFAGCSGDEDDSFPLDGTNLSISDIAGTWEGTKAIFGKTGEGPVVAVDVIQLPGYAVLTIENNGEFNVVYSVPGTFPVNTSGQLGFDEDILVMIFEETPDDFVYLSIDHDEPNLHIEGGPIEEAFDFDGDEIFEDAYIDFEFIRTQ